jgi:heme exporter protein D
MGYFSSFTEFLQMGTHGLYVWLSSVRFSRCNTSILARLIKATAKKQ